MSDITITVTDKHAPDGRRIVTFCAWCDKERQARGEPSAITYINLKTHAPSHGICEGHRRQELIAAGIDPDAVR